MEVESTRKRSYPFDEQRACLDLEVTEVRKATKDVFHFARLIWEIHDFEDQVELSTASSIDTIKSEIFTVSIPDRNTKSKTRDLEFYMSMYLHNNIFWAENDPRRDYFGLYLHFKPTSYINEYDVLVNVSNFIPVKYNFEIANVDIEQTESRNGNKITECFSTRTNKRGYYKFVRKQLILKDPSVLVNGILTVQCHMKILCNQSQPMLLPELICPPNLTCGEQIRLNEEDGADVKIICAAELPNSDTKAKVDSTTTDPAVVIKVHKLVLTSRSKVFAAMFRHDMMEKQTNTIAISDFSADTIENFVSFLYDDNCSLLKSGNASVCRLVDLLKIAHKYDVNSLKLMCEQSLSKKVSSANTSSMLQMSEQFYAKYLRSYIVRYMVLNFEKISQRRWWKDVPRDVIDDVLDVVHKS